MSEHEGIVGHPAIIRMMVSAIMIERDKTMEWSGNAKA